MQGTVYKTTQRGRMHSTATSSSSDAAGALSRCSSPPHPFTKSGPMSLSRTDQIGGGLSTLEGNVPKVDGHAELPKATRGDVPIAS